MTQVQDYLAENARYMNDGSDAVIEQLSDEQFAILIAATNALNDGCTEPGIDNKLVRTTETIADFDASRANHWSERGAREAINVGAPAVKFERVQMIKGQPRRDFAVVDLGEYRVVLA